MMCSQCGGQPEQDFHYIEADRSGSSKAKDCRSCRMKQLELRLDESQEKEIFLTAWNSVSSGLFSDVKLVAKHGRSVPTQKCILAGRSQVFRALFAGNHDSHELLDKNIVHFPDMTYEALDAFVQFFYSGMVDPELMKNHVRSLLCAAIKFDVKYLQALCEKYVRERATWNRKNLIWAFRVADEAGSTSLRSFCESHAKGKLLVRNLDWALEVAYKSGSKSLMDAALTVVLPKIHQLLTFDESKEPELLPEPSVLLKAYQAAVTKCSPCVKGKTNAPSFPNLRDDANNNDKTPNTLWPEATSSSNDGEELLSEPDDDPFDSLSCNDYE